VSLSTQLTPLIKQAPAVWNTSCLLKGQVRDHDLAIALKRNDQWSPTVVLESYWVTALRPVHPMCPHSHWGEFRPELNASEWNTISFLCSVTSTYSDLKCKHENRMLFTPLFVWVEINELRCGGDVSTDNLHSDLDLGIYSICKA
jgi:hypothetical protein